MHSTIIQTIKSNYILFIVYNYNDIVNIAMMHLMQLYINIKYYNSLINIQKKNLKKY